MKTGKRSISNSGKLRKIALAAGIIALCVVITTVFFLIDDYREEKEMIDLLDRCEGQYQKSTVILTDTTEKEMAELAAAFNGEYRMTAVGDIGVLYLPDGVTIKDVCQDDDMNGKLDRCIPSYYASPASNAERVVAGNSTVTEYLNANEALNEADGTGITVAVIDTGLDMSTGLFDGRVLEESYNATKDKMVSDADGGWSIISDEDGHGTSVASLIAASATDVLDYSGMAPKVKLLVIKCELNDDGEYELSELLIAIGHAIDRRADVINMSFEMYDSENADKLNDIFKLAFESDIVCVAASGNKGTNYPCWPACSDYVIGVGAITRIDSQLLSKGVGGSFGISDSVDYTDSEDGAYSIDSKSNFGEYNLDLVAPADLDSIGLDGKISMEQGSSQSAAVVTGAIALYMQKCASQYAEVSAITEPLYASCKDMGAEGIDEYYGYGALDVGAFIIEEKGTVTFDYLTDEISDTQAVFVRGHLLKEQPEPEREYSVFDGWYYDPACTDEYDIFADTLTADLTLYAKWANEDDTCPFTYNVLSATTAEITGYIGKRRAISIPSVIDGYTIVGIAGGTTKGAFYGNERIRSVSLPETLTYIGDNAFSYMKNLTSIKFPDALESIGVKSFAYCSRLSVISMSSASKLKTISRYAFSGCSKLTRIDLPASLETIDASAFYSDCALYYVGVDSNNSVFFIENGSLCKLNDSADPQGSVTLVYHPAAKSQAITLSDRITAIGELAFAHSRVTSVISTANLATIGERAFEYSKVTDFTFIEGLISIGEKAFYCSDITMVTLPDSLTELGISAFSSSDVTKAVIGKGITAVSGNAFADCYYLKEVTLGENINQISDKAFYKCWSLTDVIIPDGCIITRVGNRAFLDCGRLSSFAPLEDSVEYIGEYAFNATNFSSVTLTKNIKSLGKGAFYGCSSLSSVTFADGFSLEELPQQLFGYTVALKQITIPSSVKTIGNYCFISSGLTSFNVPAQVTSIGISALGSCHSLTSITVDSENTVYFDIDGVLCRHGNNYDALVCYPAGIEGAYVIPSTVSVIDSWAFFSARKLTSITFPDTVTEIGEYCCSDCINLTTLNTLALNTIPKYAFSNCKLLSNVNLNEGLASISSYAFSDCKSLTTLTLPVSVDSLGYYVFNNDDKLETVVFPEGSELHRLGTYAFSNSGIRTMNFPSTLQVISNNCFTNCKNLTSVYFADNSQLDYLTANVFKGAENLEEIDFGAGSALQAINTYALTGLTKLKTINLEECTKLQYIDNYAFQYCKSLTAVTLPDGLKNIGRYAFYSCGISELYLPTTLEHIGRYAFTFCDDIDLYFRSATLPMYLDENWSNGVHSYCIGTTTVATSEDGKWKYALLLDGTVSLQQYLGSDTELAIDTVDGYTVSSINQSLFLNNQTLTSVTLSDSIRSIFDSAFEGTTALTSVTIPSGVTYIGPAAFKNSGITSVTFADGISLYTIENEAFFGTKNLTSVSIPESVTYIRPYAFSESGISVLQFAGDSQLTEIGRNAFDKTSLSSVVFPDTLAKIDYYAFSGISSLASVTFGNAVDDESTLMIYGYAFYNTGLTSVTIPAHVNLIGEYAFSYCRSMTSMIVDENNKYYSTSDGVLFDKEQKKLISMPAGITGTYTISADVSVLGFGAFEGSSLSEIIIPEDSHLATIGYRAFYDVDSITSITLPKSLLSVDYYAFFNCSNLETVAFADDCQLGGIYEGAFEGCEKLKSISVPATVKEISDRAFYGCVNLTSVTIPADSELMIIFDYAFADTSITAINLPEGLTDIGKYAFENTLLTEFILPDSVSYLDEAALRGTSVEKLRIKSLTAYSGLDTSTIEYFFGETPETLKTVHIVDGMIIPENAFKNCTSLESVTFGTAPESIGKYAFYGCSKLKECALSANITNIPEYAFYGCSSLTELTNLENVNDIGVYAFSKSGLTSIKLHNGEKVGKYAFSSCENLQNVEMYNGTVLGEGVFSDCSSLTTVNCNDMTEIPEKTFLRCKALESGAFLKNIVKIGNNAFQYCSSLKSVDLSSAEIIGDCAFESCGLTEVALPVVKELGSYTFKNNNSMESIDLGHSLTVAGREVLSGCPIHELRIPGSLKNIPDYFMYNSWTTSNCVIEKIILEDGVESIGIYAFSIYYWYFNAGCYAEDSHLMEVVFPSTLKTIGARAFYGDRIDTLILPDGIESIGISAFEKLQSATYSTSFIYVPASINSIRGGAFTLWDVVYFESEAFPETCEQLWSDSGENYPKAVLGSAIASDSNGFTYVTSNGVVYLIKYSGEDTDIIIPNNINVITGSAFGTRKDLTSVTGGESVTIIEDETFKGNTLLTSVALAAVKEIGAYAFYNDRALVSVEMSSVTSIGDYSFYGCNALNSIDTGNVTTIGIYAFYNCDSINTVKTEKLNSLGSYAFCYSGLTSVTIPGSVLEIPDYAFYNCTSLTDVIFNTGTTSIGDYAFHQTKLTQLTLPDTMKTVGERAFARTTLSQINLNEGLTDIGEYAFSGTKASSIVIPESLRTIGYCGLYGIKSLYISNLESWLALDNMMYSYNNDSNYFTSSYYDLYLNGNLLTDLVIPDGTTEIKERAFSNCSSVRSVKFPESIAIIGARAFACSSVDTFCINDISQWCEIDFGENWNYRNVSGSGSKLYVQDETVTDFVIPEGIETLNGYAFQYSKEIKTVTFPSSIKTVNETFSTCIDLETIIIKDPASYCSVSFTGILKNHNLYIDAAPAVKLIIPDGVTEISAYAFSGCTNIVSVEMADSVISIGSYAFANTTALSNLTFSDNITVMPSYLISGSSVIGLKLPESLLTISSNAFTDSQLRYVHIPDEVTTIESKAFSGVKNLLFEGAALPQTVASDAFDADAVINYNIPLQSYVDPNTGLMYVIDNNGMGGIINYIAENLPEELVIDVIGENKIGYILSDVFKNNTTLQKLTLGSKLTQIGSNAFNGCTSLKEVIILSDTSVSIGDSAFEGCTSLNTAAVENAGEIDWGASAFKNCTALTIIKTGTINRQTIGTYTFYKNGISSFDLTGATGIGAYAFSESALKSVIIPDTVISYGEYLLASCKSLEYAEIVSNQKTLPDHTFNNCSALKTIILSDGIERLDNYCFNGCQVLQSFNLPKKLISVGVGVLNGTSLIEKTSDGIYYYKTILLSGYIKSGVVTVREGTEIIADRGSTSSKSTSITGVNLPAGLKRIGDYAFVYCTNLSQINFPSSLISIGKYAFRGDTKLQIENLDFRNSDLEEINEYAFYDCQKISTFDASGSNLKRLCNNCFQNNCLTSLILPEGVEVVQCGFKGSNIKELYIPSTVTDINLYGISGLEILTIPFPTSYMLCSTLKKLTITGDFDSLTIGTYQTRSNPSPLETLIFKGKMSGKLALYKTGIKYIELPQVKSTSQITGLSYSKDTLETIVFPDCLEEITSGIICDNFTSVDLSHTNLKKICQSAFKGLTNLKEVILPDTVEYIDAYAFQNSGLEEFSLPAGISYIGKYAFDGCCTTQKSLIIPTDCDLDAEILGYSGWDSLEYLEIPVMQKGLSSKAALKKVSVTRTIGDGTMTFSSCKSLEEIILPEGMTSIGTNMFAGCTKLVKVIIPSTVTEILYQNTKLPGMKLPDGLKTIDSATFTSLILNAGITSCKATATDLWVINCPLSAISGKAETVDTMVVNTAVDRALPASSVNNLILGPQVTTITGDLIPSNSDTVIYCYQEKDTCQWVEGWNNGCKVYYRGEWNYTVYTNQYGSLEVSLSHLGGVVHQPSALKTKYDDDSIYTYSFIGWDTDGDGKVDDLLVSAPTGYVEAVAVYQKTLKEDYAEISDPETQVTADGVEISANVKDAEKYNIQIGADTLSGLTDTKMTVKSGLVDITFDEGASGDISKAESDVNLVIEQIDPELLNMSADKDIVFNFGLTSDGEDVLFSNGYAYITIQIDYVPAEGTVPVYYIAPTGAVTMVESTFDPETMCLTMKTEHFSTYIVRMSETTDKYLITNVTVNRSVTFAEALAFNYYYTLGTNGEYFGTYDKVWLELEIRDYTTADSYEFTDEQGVGYNVVSTTLNNWTEDTQKGYSRYRFSLRSIYSYEAGNIITAVLHATKGEDVYYTAEDVNSIKQYAYSRLEKSTSSTLKTLLVDFLNYSAASQIHFGYNTTELVNADLTEAQKALGTQNDVEVSHSEEVLSLSGDKKATISSKSVVFANSIELKYYMTFDESADVNNCVLKLTYTSEYGNVITKVLNGSDFVYDSANKRYSAKLTTIAAYDADKIVSATILENGVAISDTLNYSLDIYAKNRIAKTTSETLKALLQNMLKYTQSASLYF